MADWDRPVYWMLSPSFSGLNLEQSARYKPESDSRCVKAAKKRPPNTSKRCGERTYFLIANNSRCEFAGMVVGRCTLAAFFVTAL